MPAIVFDIETGPLPEELLYRAIEPFPAIQPFPELAPFDPASVKCGNIKDEAKKAEKIEAARASHESDYEAAKANHLVDYERKRKEYYASAVEKAALSAETGQVLAIGFGSIEVMNASDQPIETILVDHQENYANESSPPEAAMLRQFWHRYDRCVNGGASLIGFNSHNFDLPFLIRRSWLLGVRVPSGILERGRYWHPLMIDLLATWKCGQMGGGGANGSISLGRLAVALGLPGKNGSGADFARLWVEDRVLAIDYLRNDILMTAKVAMALGVC